MVAAVQLPQVRDDLVRMCSSDLVGQLLGMHLLRGGDTDLPSPEAGMEFDLAVEAYQRRLANLAGVAELFHVSLEMTEVADTARRDMPGYRLHKEDLPAERGLIFFDAPIGVFDAGCDDPHLSPYDRREIALAKVTGREVAPAVVVAALWGPALDRSGREGVLVVTWTDSSYLAEHQERTGNPAGAAAVRGLGALSYHDETVLPFGDYYDEGAGLDQPVRNQALGTLLCAWLLMGQRIVSTSEAPLPRQTRRRFVREGRPVPAVRVVKLRHARRPAAEEDGEGSGREYRHRWLVRGHWRNQWYPSRQANRPIFIPTYVKGPEGAPLLGAEKVYDWSK